jgi:hypothetical protein
VVKQLKTPFISSGVAAISLLGVIGLVSAWLLTGWMALLAVPLGLYSLVYGVELFFAKVAIPLLSMILGDEYP